MNELARLLVPALRWRAGEGYEAERGTIDEALELGVGGFILFGGEADTTRALCDELQARSPHPLLIGSDLERGAGQQIAGATPLPPAAGLGSLQEAELARRAGELTAREARALGINWVFAPVADIDVEPRNPIVGSRAFGTTPASVAPLVSAWVRGCRAGGALSCVKHFPGHGRTVADSHVERPTVDADRSTLGTDLHPFNGAFDAGADSVMSAHVAYPALDPSGAPATLSTPILHELLRREMGFGGLVVTDAINMKGLTEGMTEIEGAARSAVAGCDLLLYVIDLPGTVAALEKARSSGQLAEDRLEASLDRIERAAERFANAESTDRAWGAEEDRRWAMETARRTLVTVRGEPRLPHGGVQLVEVDDDVGGPFPPYVRDALAARLESAGVRLGDDGTPLVAVYADIRAWKGRPGLSAQTRDRVKQVLERDPDVTVLLFGHPRLAEELPDARHLLAAWGGESLMQEAVAAHLTGADDAVASVAPGLPT